LSVNVNITNAPLVLLIYYNAIYILNFSHSERQGISMFTRSFRVLPRTLLTFSLLALLLVSWVIESGTSFAAGPAAVPPVNNGILQCLTVSLTLNNDRLAHLQVTVGVDNACPADVSAPINWQIDSMLSCGDKTIPGPSDKGQTVNTLLKSHMYTMVNEGFNITCILNGAPAYWTTDVTATVDGDILYGNYDIASGTATRSLGGV
jgi:hypothetical protein